MAVKGTWNIGGVNLPDFGWTEALASNIRALNQPGFVNPTYANTPQGQQLGLSNQSNAQTPDVLGATTQPSGGQSVRNYSPVPANNTVNVPQNNGGGGGGGGNAELQQLEAMAANGTINPSQQTQLNEMRSRAQQSSNRGVSASIAAFDARKQGIMNKIPYLQQQRDLTIKGLDQGLEQFSTTADQELAKRLQGFQQQEGQVNEDYTGAARSTRSAAQALSKQIRNQFAGLGTLDSTAYRDANIESSRGIAQEIGDITREKAGKLSTIGSERGDTEQYYAQQKLAEQQRVTLEKEKITAQTDQLVQGTLDDANLSDAQKVEAITQAESRLADRLSELDNYEIQLKTQADSEAKDYALKIAQLQDKKSSAGYDQTLQARKAIESAAAVVQDFTDRYGQISPEQAQAIFTQYGVDPEQATFYGGLYGGKDSSKYKPQDTELLNSLGLN